MGPPALRRGVGRRSAPPDRWWQKGGPEWTCVHGFGETKGIQRGFGMSWVCLVHSSEMSGFLRRFHPELRHHDSMPNLPSAVLFSDSLWSWTSSKVTGGGRAKPTANGGCGAGPRFPDDNPMDGGWLLLGPQTPTSQNTVENALDSQTRRRRRS